MATGPTPKPVSDWQTVTTEESEHARQLAPARPLPGGTLDRLLAPKYLDRKPGDPNTFSGYGQHAGEALRGMGQGVRSLVSTPLPGMKDNPVIWNPVTQIKKDFQGLKDWNELRRSDPDYAWGAIFGPMLLSHTIAKIAPAVLPAGMADKLAAGAHVNPEDVEPVAADLRAAASEHGTPQTVGEFVDVASKAQNKLNEEYSSALGKHALTNSNLPDVNGNFPLSDAILKLKDKYPPGTSWSNAARRMIDKRASEYQRPVKLGDLDLERKNANSRIDAFEASAQIKQAGKRIATPEIAVDETIANWVRDNVYPEMDQLTGKPPGYFRNLKLRVGNLMRLQSDAEVQAEKVSRASGIERGTPKLSHARLGASVGPSGEPHGWIGNLASILHTPDPEAAADTAVTRAFDMKRLLSPSKAARRTIKGADMPLSALVGGESGVEDRTNKLIDFLRQKPQ